ncbi:hypothetical protein D3C85_1110140 [compost metagenome]
MLAVQLVQAERLEDHLVGVAQHVVQAQRIGLEQASPLQLAIRGLRAGEPLVAVQALRHRIPRVAEFGGADFQPASGRELPFHLGGQAHKAGHAILRRDGFHGILAQPNVVGVGGGHGGLPADLGLRQAQLVGGLGAIRLGQHLVLQLGDLVLGQQVVARVGLRLFGEAPGDEHGARLLDVSPFAAVLADGHGVVVQGAAHGHIDLPERHGAVAAHRQDHIVVGGRRVVDLLVPFRGGGMACPERSDAQRQGQAKRGCIVRFHEDYPQVEWRLPGASPPPTPRWRRPGRWRTRERRARE